MVLRNLPWGLPHVFLLLPKARELQPDHIPPGIGACQNLASDETSVHGSE